MPGYTRRLRSKMSPSCVRNTRFDSGSELPRKLSRGGSAALTPSSRVDPRDEFSSRGSTKEVPVLPGRARAVTSGLHDGRFHLWDHLLHPLNNTLGKSPILVGAEPDTKLPEASRNRIDISRLETSRLKLLFVPVCLSSSSSAPGQRVPTAAGFSATALGVGGTAATLVGIGTEDFPARRCRRRYGLRFHPLWHRGFRGLRLW